MFREHHLELLKTAAHGLGIPEPHDRHDDRGNDEEDEVVFPADGFDGDRGDHVDYEVPQPIAQSVGCFWGRRRRRSNIPMIRRRNARHTNPQPRRRNLRTVQKVCTKEADRDEEVEHEHEKCRRDLCGVVGFREGGGDGEREHARRHADAGEHEELAAPEPVDSEEGDEAGEEFPG